jgi:hypothetical protein
MKSRIKILSGIITLSLVFIAALGANAQGTSNRSREYEGYVFETVGFLIPYATFRELIKEKNIKMTLNGAEFELPGWVRGQLNNVVGMVGS